MDLINIIVRQIIKARYEDLPKQSVEEMKKLIIDTIGSTIAGSGAVESKKIVNLVRHWGGIKESTILTYGGRVPAPNAAFANCTMARALELDGVHGGGGGHLLATFVPTCVVLSEYCQTPVTGKNFILATMVGAELSCRLRCALRTYLGWTAETFAPFGVVAMAAKLFRFDEERLLNGFGLAYSLCSCNLQANIDGSSAVSLQQGLGAKAGVLATILAQEGFTGGRNVLQGTYGFYPLYGRNEYDPEVIIKGFGEKFEMIDTSIKFYSSCAFTHVPIYATLGIVSEHNVAPHEIDRIEVYTNSKAYNLAGYGENKYHPRNTVDAQFSIPYTVATAAIRRKVFLNNFTEESINDPEVFELARKVTVEVDPNLDKIAGLIVPGRVTLQAKDGRCFSKSVEYVKGHPKNPASLDDIVQKFRDCVSFAAKPFEKNKIIEFEQVISSIEKVENIGRMAELLVA